MQQEELQNILSDKLVDLKFNEESKILHARYAYNQFTVGNFFIDYSNRGLDLNLSEYQEKFIANEYYNVPGHLQWNFYLIFLRESYQEIEKQRIEKDDIFTRKYVFNPMELTQYFNYQKSEKSIDTDVVHIWKEKLKEVDLDEVYSESPYSQAIPRFLNGEPFKDVDDREQNFSDEIQNIIIKQISKLHLKAGDYRPYPNIRDFSLGSVNLFKGANGTGKTSLLEAIELIITGKSYRDPKFQEKNNCIEAIYNNDVNQKDSYNPTDNAKYRNRDNEWYSTAKKKGNELYLSFNRYNFFDSDAAYNLSYKSDVDTLAKYLSAISLGTEFNRIRTRLLGFQERLSKEINVRQKSINDETERIDLAKSKLSEITSNSNPEDKFDSFRSFADEIQWKLEIPKTINNSFVYFEESYQISRALTDSLKEILAIQKLRSISAAEENLKKFVSVLAKCISNKEDRKEINKAIKIKDDFLKGLNEKLTILDSAHKYFSDKQSFELLTLSGDQERLSVDIKKAQRITGQIVKIKDESIYQIKSNFGDYKNTQLKDQEELLTKKNQLKSQASALKSNLDKLQSVVSDIKNSGNEYLSINPEADTCPLCQAEYSSTELSNRISKIVSDIKENSLIVSLNNQLLTIDKKLEKVTSTLADINIIESCILEIYTEPKYSKLNFVEISNIFMSTKNELASKEIEYSRLLKVQQELNDKEIFELQFNHVKEDVESFFTELKLEYKYKSIYNDIKAELKNNIVDTSAEIKALKAKVIDLEKIQKNLIDDVAPSINHLEFEDEFNYKIDLLKKGLSYFEELNSFIDISNEDDISDINLKLTQFYKVFEDFKKSMSNEKELKLAQEIISSSNKKIHYLKTEFDRIQIGLKVINDILINDSESSVLGNFISTNESEIQEIFKSLHTPQEFSKIIFDVENNSVLLRRRIDGSDVPMNKISTGQRSALALSIFIALNKKLKNGPYVMLFDDPVTYTDDLNVLSFLDYLRELVLNENRQLFFATANQKLAGLFEKKFAFLGEDEFKSFNFER